MSIPKGIAIYILSGDGLMKTCKYMCVYIHVVWIYRIDTKDNMNK